MGKTNGVICTKWTPREKNTLRGLATIRVLRWHLTIGDVAVHEQGSKRWVLLPAKARLSPGDELVRKDNGKPEYTSVITIDDPDVAARFTDAVLRAVDQYIGDAHG